MGSCLDSHQKRNPDYSFYFTFEKANISKFFFLNDYHTFEKIMAILKNYCIMRNFNKKYEIIQYLGRGHFAEVFSAKNKANKQIYAVKIFQKKTEKFQKNQVL